MWIALCHEGDTVDVAGVSFSLKRVLDTLESRYNAGKPFELSTDLFKEIGYGLEVKGIKLNDVIIDLIEMEPEESEDEDY